MNDFEAGAPTPKKQNFAVDAAPELSSIAITTPATKLNYTVGESLDITGMIVTGTYSDASSKIEPVIPGNITGFDSSKPATGEVLTITIGGPDRNLYNQCKQFRKSKFSRNC